MALIITEEMKKTAKDLIMASAAYQKRVFTNLFQTEIPPFGTEPDKFTRGLDEFRAHWQNDARTLDAFRKAASDKNPELIPSGEAESAVIRETRKAKQGELMEFLRQIETDTKELIRGPVTQR